MPDRHWTRPSENWIQAVAAHVGVPSRRRARLLDELRGHLADSADRLAESGLERHEAERRAVASMGSPSEVAEAFLAEANAPSALTRAAGLALVAAAVLAVFQMLTPTDEFLGDVRGSLQLFGMVGLYLRQRYRLGRRGREAIRRVILVSLAMIAVLLVASVLMAFVGGLGDVVGLVSLGIGAGALVVVLWNYLVYAVETVRARVLPVPHAIAAHLLFAESSGKPVPVFAALLVAASTTWLGLWLCCERAPVHLISEPPDRQPTPGDSSGRRVLPRHLLVARRWVGAGTVLVVLASTLMFRTFVGSAQPHGPAYPAWPTRGDLAGDTRYVDAARVAWNSTPIDGAVHTYHGVRALYAGRTRLGVVVLLTGLDERGSRRVAVFRQPAYHRAPGTRMVLAGDLGTPDPGGTRHLAMALGDAPLGDLVVVAVAEPGTSAMRLYDAAFERAETARRATDDGTALFEADDTRTEVAGYRNWRQTFRHQIPVFFTLWGLRPACGEDGCERSFQPDRVVGWVSDRHDDPDVPGAVQVAWMHRDTVRMDASITASYADVAALSSGRVATLAVLSQGRGNPHLVLAVPDGDVVDFYRDQPVGARPPYGVAAVIGDDLVVFAQPGLRIEARAGGRLLADKPAGTGVFPLSGRVQHLDVNVVDATGRRHPVPVSTASI